VSTVYLQRIVSDGQIPPGIDARNTTDGLNICSQLEERQQRDKSKLRRNLNELEMSELLLMKKLFH
jgi:hypothetical protein